MKIRTALAVGYKRLKYGFFSGTQYFDTGVNGNNANLDIVVTYEPNTTNQQCIFAARTSTSGGISFWTDGYCHFGNSSIQVSGVSITGKHTVRLNKSGLYFDGKKLNFTTGSSFHSANLVFGRIPTDNRTYTGKIYRVTVYNGATLIRDIVPAKRSSDSVIGYYDLVTNTFYINRGTGTITGAEEKERYRIRTGDSSEQFMIKYDTVTYTRKQYIKRIGGVAYFDTGFIPDYTAGFDIEFYFKPNSLGQRYCLGANYNVGSLQISLELNASNQARFWVNGNDLIKTGTVSNTSTNYAKFSFKNGLCTLNCNGTIKTANLSMQGKSTTSMWLFLDRAQRTTIYTSPLSIYECKITSGDNLIHWFFPVTRNTDNALGFYDKIQKKFIAVSGSDNFTYE